MTIDQSGDPSTDPSGEPSGQDARTWQGARIGLPTLPALIDTAPSPSADPGRYAEWLGRSLRELVAGDRDERRGFGEAAAQRVLLIGGLIAHGQDHLRSDRLGYRSYSAWLGDVVGIGPAQVRRYRIACDRLAPQIIVEHKLGIGAAYQIALCDSALRRPLLVAWGQGARVFDLALARRTVAPLWDGLGERRAAELVQTICRSGKLPDDLAPDKKKSQVRRAEQAHRQLASALSALLGQGGEAAAALELLRRCITDAAQVPPTVHEGPAAAAPVRPEPSAVKSKGEQDGRAGSSAVQGDRAESKEHEPAQPSQGGPAGPPRFHPTWTTIDRDSFARLYDPLPSIDPIARGSVEVYIPPQLKALEDELAEQEEQRKKEERAHRYDHVVRDPAIRQLLIEGDEREEMRRWHNSPEQRARHAEFIARQQAAFRKLEEQAAEQAAKGPGATP